MNNLVINGEQISEYLQELEKLINQFVNEIETMKISQNIPNWVSINKEHFYEIYNNKINNHYLFAKKCYVLINFLNQYVDYYNDCVAEIKSNFNELDNIFGR